MVAKSIFILLFVCSNIAAAIFWGLFIYLAFLSNSGNLRKSSLKEWLIKNRIFQVAVFTFLTIALCVSTYLSFTHFMGIKAAKAETPTASFHSYDTSKLLQWLDERLPEAKTQEKNLNSLIKAIESLAEDVSDLNTKIASRQHPEHERPTRPSGTDGKKPIETDTVLDLIKLGTISPFKSANHIIENPQDNDSIRKIISALNGLNKTGKIKLLIIIGKADKRPLGPSSKQKYGSNIHLAFERASFIKEWLNKNAFKNQEAPKVKIIASGPDYIDPAVESKFMAEDRAVTVYAIVEKRSPDSSAG